MGGQRYQFMMQALLTLVREFTRIYESLCKKVNENEDQFLDSRDWGG